jgi:predicted AlkP superfamily phosphohydrolase/phosphomutase
MLHRVVCAFCVGVVALAGTGKSRAAERPPTNAEPRLFWFIPDGMRADPELFNIYKWAEAGKLPNIRRMMQRGTYGFARPVFPSHTPANFASLFTGAYPEVHGVNDGPMHTEGNPLGQVSVSGFTSTAKKVEPIWVTLERALQGETVLLSVPGSTPPELKKGITIRGRWGRWGADFPAINFQDSASTMFQSIDPNAARLFYQGPRLTQPTAKQPANGWGAQLQSHSTPLEASLPAWGATAFAHIADSTDNGIVDYDKVSFSTNKTDILCELKTGQWSSWLPIVLQWQIPAQKLERAVPTSVKIKLIRLETNGQFRIRFLYNNLNKFLTEPDYFAEEILQGAGPMVDFVDNFPPQLIYFPEDKQTFLEEAELSLKWHREAASFILQRYRPAVFIQNTYTPNQMLTSRWWMGHVDPRSSRYDDVSPAEREALWKEVYWLYARLDDIVGALLARATENTVVALSSDHGAVPFDTQVRLNNLFAREGLLKFRVDEKTRERVINWPETKVIYLNMHNIYIHPAGLGGDWKRASGPEYERLRRKVRGLLANLTDRNGVKPVEKIVDWEKAGAGFRLQPERAGDLIIANRAGYGWSEEVTESGELFGVPLVSGYKQAILPESTKGLWTPFIVMGPGIRKGHYLGDKPIELVDEYPTLLSALGMKPARWVQGRAVKSALERR